VNLLEKIAWYRKNRGLRALVRRAFKGRDASFTLPGEAARTGAMTPSAAELKAALSGQVTDVDSLVRQAFAPIQPLPIYQAPGPRARINLVTDSISSGSLFGGVATAIILAVLLAKRTGAKLRVVTRSEAPDEAGFAHVLSCNGIDYDDNVEFVQMALWDTRAQLDICAGDRFLTTSWWTTASVLGSVPASKVDYLLQEDERMFYPYGDEWLRCQELLSRQDIRFIVNTHLLYRHFLASGLEHMERQGVWFEPAFPTRPPNESAIRKSGEKLKFFFYARPNNLRNLFYRGIEVLNQAVTEGALDPARWDVYFVGKDIPKLKLGGVMEPIVLPTMGWKDYGDFVASVDLGFCLMSTPHPSYPPLDLAVAGALVLTNQFGLKQDLSEYSGRISCVPLDTGSLVKGLRQALEHAERERKTGRPQGTYHHLSTSWTDSLAAVVERLG